MSFINRTKKFIFVHVPKTGGTALSVDLAPLTTIWDIEVGGTHFGELSQAAYEHRFNLRKHSSASEIRRIVGDGVWQDFFTFAMVREPYSRVVSTFRFLKGWRDWDGSDIMDSFDSVSQFVHSAFWDNPDSDFTRSQSYFTGHGTDSQVKDIYKLEQYSTEVERLFVRLGAKYRYMGMFRNESPDIGLTPSQTTLDQAAVEKIANRYANDFKSFGYSFIQERPPQSSRSAGIEAAARP